MPEVGRFDEGSARRFPQRRAFVSVRPEKLLGGLRRARATLKGVVIPKLPFAKPTDPLSCERALRDSSAWSHYTPPQAAIEIKQAAEGSSAAPPTKACSCLPIKAADQGIRKDVPALSSVAHHYSVHDRRGGPHHCVRIRNGAS
ncbi:MAG: hypothetical protein ACLT98_09600 [Eggerthellaceae bacterium]